MAEVAPVLRYRVLDPCYEGEDVTKALEDELNELADQGWHVVAVVPVRNFRIVEGKVQVSEDKVDALVLEKST